MFTRVYGPILLREKKDFWEELKTIRGLWDDPWCIGGDFNFVGLIGEKRNDFRFMANMRRLLNVIKELRLKDLPPSGGQFLWCGGLNSQVTSRLDHFLVSNEWEDHFSGISQFAFSVIAFDHCPIILKGGGVKKGKTPFRYENM